MQERANTSEAFRLALRLGATGLWGELRRTADGQGVIHREPVIGWRRRPISSTVESELPTDILRLNALVDLVGSAEVFLDVADVLAVPELLAGLEGAGAGSPGLWLVHPDLDLLTEWRSVSAAVHLVHTARLRQLEGGPERHAARLRERSIDAMAMHQSDWSAGLTTLFHRFGRLAVATDADHVRIARVLLDDGVDAVVGPHIDRLVDAAASQAV